MLQASPCVLQVLVPCTTGSRVHSAVTTKIVVIVTYVSEAVIAQTAYEPYAA